MPLTLQVLHSSISFSTNDRIRLSSTFHTMHTISSQINPYEEAKKFAGSQLYDGIELVESDTFRLQCFQSYTGVKFILYSEPHHTDLDAYLAQVYEAYSDFVSKNPFYEADMPIRSDLFEKRIEKIFS